MLAPLALAFAADVRLPAVLSDHAVLQRDARTAIWGWAAPGEAVRVTVGWDGQPPVDVKADPQGRFRVEVKTAAAGGPFEIRVDATNHLVIRDVMLGEVWLCSGQSNMEKPIGPIQGQLPCDDYKNEVAAADHAALRMFTVRRAQATSPQEQCAGTWEVSSPKTAAQFSACAYYFGLDLYQALGVPVGLVHSSWGGTPIELWTSEEALADVPTVAPRLQSSDAMRAAHGAAMIAWEKKAFSADPAHAHAAEAAFDDTSWKSMQVPGEWSAAGLGAFDGFVWFRRHVELPAGWDQRAAALELGPIDDDDVTYVNGVRVGATEGWDHPRRYTLAAGMLHRGDNVIAVRVLDTGGEGGFHGGEAALRLVAADAPPVALAGAWKFDAAAPLASIPPKPALESREHSTLYNAMIAPLTPFAIRGAIWYQGEANVGRAEQYQELLPAMIGDWRSRFGRGAFPFYWVQIAPYAGYGEDAAAAELREAQRLALRTPGGGMAVTTDIASDVNDIHPTNKRDVGKRLARWALHDTYAKSDVVPSGPLYKSMKIEGASIRVEFNYADGLSARGGALKEFTIAGADRKFVAAQAAVDGKSIVVSAPGVTAPQAVRFGWSKAPLPNLFNGAGLPASPFRTDDWPLVTHGRVW